MTVSTFLLLALTGILAGFLGGLVGIGGGVVMVPMLVLVMGMAQKEAQGTSLAVLMIPLSVGVAAWNYYKAGQVNIKYALIIALFFMAGGYLGSKLALNIDQNIIKKVFAGFLVLIAVKIFIGK